MKFMFIALQNVDAGYKHQNDKFVIQEQNKTISAILQQNKPKSEF